MSDVLHLNKNATSISGSPLYEPVSKVRILVGEDEDGNQIIYEAGNDSGRVMDLENPYGTQAIANQILQRMRGQRYRPYKADGAIIDPAVELGDAVYVGDIYAPVLELNTEFGPLMSADIGAPDDGDLDHEYPYETHENRETIREINGLKTSFKVELGRISTEISETYQTIDQAYVDKQELRSEIVQTSQSITATVAATYETKSAAQSEYTALQSQITQTANSITSQVAATYETKVAATAGYNGAKDYADNIKLDLESTIEQTAEAIKSTVASSEVKYDERFLTTGTITLYGYGQPPASLAREHPNEYYLDQSSGWVYKSNGTSWARQGTSALPLITEELNSKIVQTSSEIRMEVSSNDGLTTFVLTSDGVAIDTTTVNMTVDAAYISGIVVADRVKANTTIESPSLIWYNQYNQPVASISASYDSMYISAMTGIDMDALVTMYSGLTVNGIIDFSSATKVTMPDGTVFQ